MTNQGPHYEQQPIGHREEKKQPHKNQLATVNRFSMDAVEVSPAILRKTFEGMRGDWEKVYEHANHVQIDITDGVFAGDGSFRDVKEFKKFPQSEKIELHMMVHTPANFIDDIIDLNPARVIFHLEAFEGTNDLDMVYARLREQTSSLLGLAINPDSPNERLAEQLDKIDFALFMGYNPGWAGQKIDERVYRKIGSFRDAHPNVPISVDGGVGKESVPLYVKAGAVMLAANSSVFKEGNPVENLKQLQLLAESA